MNRKTRISKLLKKWGKLGAGGGGGGNDRFWLKLLNRWHSFGRKISYHKKFFSVWTPSQWMFHPNFLNPIWAHFGSFRTALVVIDFSIKDRDEPTWGTWLKTLQCQSKVGKESCPTMNCQLLPPITTKTRQFRCRLVFFSTSLPQTSTRWFDQHFQAFHALSAVD